MPLIFKVTVPVASGIVTVIFDATHWVLSGASTEISGQSFLVTDNVVVF